MGNSLVFIVPHHQKTGRLNTAKKCAPAGSGALAQGCELGHVLPGGLEGWVRLCLKVETVCNLWKGAGVPWVGREASAAPLQAPGALGNGAHFPGGTLRAW